jgi:hypothetical protein
MPTDLVSLSIAPVAPRLDMCELCAHGPESLQAWIVVRHARGGTVQLAACDRCRAAVRRIMAVAGSGGAAGPAQVAAKVNPVSTTARVELATVHLVGKPVLIHRFSEPFRIEDGPTYIVRALGQRRSDGTWIGWLEFTDVASGAVRRTGRETTQSNREQLVYWATGLEQVYLMGAIGRAS